jgi:peroxiredoxin
VTYADAVTIVGVAWAGSSADYNAFTERHGLTFDNLDDSGGDVFSYFGVPSQPAFAFISKDGTVDVQIGTLTEEDFEARIRGLTTG